MTRKFENTTFNLKTSYIIERGVFYFGALLIIISIPYPYYHEYKISKIPQFYAKITSYKNNYVEVDFGSLKKKIYFTCNHKYAFDVKRKNDIMYGDYQKMLQKFFMVKQKILL